ncbi:MAG: carboxy terminal-processing peptidase [Puniceicoccales bacterium]|nr:carboxy terminal-processing peptidase [Puniceicoccales bacterium]
MKRNIFRPIHLGVCIGLLFATPVFGDGGGLAPTAQMRTEIIHMVRCLGGIHYAHRPLSSLPLDEVLDVYLNNLDGTHMFFLQSDVDEIHSRYNLTLDIFLNSGSIKPAFGIYELFQERVNDRIDDVLQMLAGDLQLGDLESYCPDRKDAPWPENEESAQELWRQRVEFEYINALLEEERNPKFSQMANVLVGEKAAGQEINDAKDLPTDNAEDASEQLAPRARERLIKRYKRLREAVNDVEPWMIQEWFLDSVASLYDPHSSFLSADSWEEFQYLMTHSFFGIGTILQDDEGYCKIVEIYPGSPAEASKQLHPGDRIIAVGQGDAEPVELLGMRFSRAAKLIRGTKGTTVTLIIQPVGADPSERKIVRIVRDEVQLMAQRARAHLYKVPDGTGQTIPIGYVKLPAFYSSDESHADSNSYGDVKELLLKLGERRARGIILDLRGNSGGILEEAVSIGGLFMPKLPVVQVRDSEGTAQVLFSSDAEPTCTDPLLILTSKQSVSASEILAGSLQCYGRALIVGDGTTYGKGSVQAILPIGQSLLYVPDGLKLGAVRITFQKWYLPNGNSIQQCGVRADIPMPSTNDYLPFGEEHLDHPLPWDSITPALGDGDFVLPEFVRPVTRELISFLSEKNAQRREMDEWKLFEEQLQLFKERMERKTFSLQIDERRWQKKEDSVRNDRLKKKIRELAQNTYEREDIFVDAAPGGDFGERMQKYLDSTTGDDDLPEFDIHLRESLRILADWIGWQV